MWRMSRLTVPLLTLCVAAAWGQSNPKEPHIGYLYPAGGRQGSTIQIIAGGQSLRGAGEVVVSGQGVHATVTRYIKPLTNLQKEQRELIRQRLNEVRDRRLAELSGESGAAPVGRRERGPEVSGKEDGARTKAVEMPEHPLLIDLEDKSLRELAHIASVLFAPRNKQQPNRQIAETVLIEITIDADAAPGDRELRIGTQTALTNPMIFQVGLSPEVRELEPNNRQAYPVLGNLPRGVNVPKEKPIDLPVLLNGQITPGDVDRFRFRAHQGQPLVIEAQARSLIPYLADAVPGWFQATLALYDAVGHEVAYADDYRFNPDPVLFYRIPADGEYELEIHDSIYRGREDFVYRIAVSERPFVTQTFPLGGRMGVETVASVSGWNLPETPLALDTQGGDSGIRRTAYRQGNRQSNAILYAVDTLPECSEIESNNTAAEAQAVDLPKIVNGRIAENGDVDVFRFEGRAGNAVVAEVTSRRLNSPLDSLLRLTDASGRVLAWNDDYVIKDGYLYEDMAGLITHHADSYLTFQLPEDGTYYVHLADSQRHGGAAYGYRLRIGAPRPDFALRVIPSGLSVSAGGIVPLCVQVLRKDGFDGEIEVILKDAPGFQLSGGRIPRGSDRVRMTLTAPAEASDRPVALQVEGRARIGGETVSHAAVAAEDMMQAYLYRHLVPAQELLVAVRKSKWRVPPIVLAGRGPVRIPAGGSARVLMRTRRRAALQELQLELREPPDGLTLHDVTVVPEGLAFHLKADADAPARGFANNLIVEAFREFTPKQKDGKPASAKRRNSMGVLPAIPIEIVP